MSVSIVIIEDNKGVNASIASILKRNNFDNITQVYNRDDAFTAITRNYFDIAIIDLNLEGENVPLPEWRDTGGVHILRMLKEMNLGTKSIVLTASPDTRLSFELARDFNVSDYIPKDSAEFVKQTIASINNIASLISINYPEDEIRFFSHIHSGIDRHIWLTNILHMLNCSVKDISSLLTDVLKDIYPASFSPNSSGLSIDKSLNIIHGTLWSFKLGKAIEVTIKSTNNACTINDSFIEKKENNLTFNVSNCSVSYEEMFKDGN